MNEETKRLNVNLDKNIYKALKLILMKEDTNITKWIIKKIKEKLSEQRDIPTSDSG